MRQRSPTRVYNFRNESEKYESGESVELRDLKKLKEKQRGWVRAMLSCRAVTRRAGKAGNPGG